MTGHLDTAKFRDLELKTRHDSVDDQHTKLLVILHNNVTRDPAESTWVVTRPHNN